MFFLDGRNCQIVESRSPEPEIDRLCNRVLHGLSNWVSSESTCRSVFRNVLAQCIEAMHDEVKLKYDQRLIRRVRTQGLHIPSSGSKFVHVFLFGLLHIVSHTSYWHRFFKRSLRVHFRFESLFLRA